MQLTLKRLTAIGVQRATIDKVARRLSERGRTETARFKPSLVLKLNGTYDSAYRIIEASPAQYDRYLRLRLLGAMAVIGAYRSLELMGAASFSYQYAIGQLSLSELLAKWGHSRGRASQIAVALLHPSTRAMCRDIVPTVAVSSCDARAPVSTAEKAILRGLLELLDTPVAELRRVYEHAHPYPPF